MATSVVPTATPSGVEIHQETAVPTLKVMRLQKPELHMPTAGTLDTRSLLCSAMCLPDSFGVIHVGETFTAYLGALNVSKVLNVTRLTVTAQLQTPSQRWSLASTLDPGNAAGGVDVPPEGAIDAIVSHPLEEAGQHILRVEVGYGGSDGSVKTLRKFYRFQVTNPLIISELTIRTGDSSCFVSISLENNAAETKGGLTICSAEFDPAPGLTAEKIEATRQRRHGDGKDVSALELFDRCGRLEAGASVRYLFKVMISSKEASHRGIAAGDELGKAVFTWRKAVGEMGRMVSSPILCPEQHPVLNPQDPTATMVGRDSRFVMHIDGSSLPVDVAAAAAHSRNANIGTTSALETSLPVTVEPIDPPRTMQLATPEAVEFLIVNHSDRARTLQLQFRFDLMSDLKICGPSFKALEELPPGGGSTTVGLRFLALSAGLLRIQGCCIVDMATGDEIPQPPLFNVLVENNALDQ